MKSRRYSEEQIVRILGEIGSGRSVAETARQYGVAEATIYRWRERFGGVSDTGGVRGAVQAEGGGERTLCGLRSGYALPPPTQQQGGCNPLTLTGLENGGRWLGPA